MKIAIIGASGFVGTAVLNEAISRGHQVTAIARDLSKVTVSSPLLTLAKGDINDPAHLAQLLAGHDVVINAFNAGWDNPNLYNDFLAGSKAIEKAVEVAGVKRYITVGGAGSLYVGEHQLVDSPEFPAEYKAGATAARDYLNILKQNTTLDWTFFSPAIEMHRGITTGRTGKYRLGTENPVFDANGRSVLSVEDLAIVLVDEVENHQFSRRRFTAAY